MPDPIAVPRRNTFYDPSAGVIMQPVQLSLVIGKKGSGVTTLLNAARERVDMQHMLIVDEDGTNGATPPLPEAWDSDEITTWLMRYQELSRQEPGSPPATSHIILASSNLHAPRHLLQALASTPALSQHFRLNAVTQAIDASTPKKQTKAVGPANRATAIADRIILTKTDRARPEAVTRLAKVLKAQNLPAPILRAQNGDIGPARLVDSGLFDPITGAIDIDRWLREAASRGGPNLPVSASGGPNNENGVRFFAITLDQPIDGAMLSVFLKLLIADRAYDLLRLKGIVATKDHPDRPALIDAREHLIQPLLWLPTWPTADRRSRLVFSTLDSSETWIRTLLTTLSDELKLKEMSGLQMAIVDKVG